MKNNHLDFSHKGRYYSICYLIIFISLFLISCSGKKDKIKKPSLMMGIAEVNYTPEVGLDLVGNYRGNDYASRGVHDSLFCQGYRSFQFKRGKGCYSVN